MASKQPISRSMIRSLFMTMVITALLLMSCSAPANLLATVPTPTAGSASPTPLVGLAALGTPTAMPPSPTPQVIMATPTLPPTATTPPTATPLMALDTPTMLDTPTALVSSQLLLPTSTPLSSGNFALLPGTTAGVITGTIQPGQVLSYTLNVGQAQPLTLIMTSPYSDVTLGVFEQGGNTLLDPNARLTRWQLVMPASELYTVEVIGGGSTETFQLTIKLPLVESFASGASSATLSGTTVNGYLFSYSLNCAAGQNMSAGLDVPSSTAYIDVYGMASGTLLSASNELNSWSGILPQTQDYIIEVVPTNGEVTNFNLSVSCTGTPGGNYSPSGTVSSGGQVYFYPGQTMSTVQGQIAPGQVVSYSVSAQAFQPMMLIVASPNVDAVVGVLDPDGVRLLDPASEYTYWQWTLPKTGNYTVQVVGGVTTESYTLTIKLGKLLTFPSKNNSIYQYATTLKGYIKSYALRLSAGDVMTVSLNVPSTTAYLDIFGVQTGAILNASDRQTSWTGTLPSQQEYVIEVIPGGTESAFTLTISNP